MVSTRRQAKNDQATPDRRNATGSHSESTSKPKAVFLTVGTTKFDDLIASIFSDSVLSAFVDLGFTDLVVQYGNSPLPDNLASVVASVPIQPTLLGSSTSSSSSSAFPTDQQSFQYNKLNITIFKFKPSLLTNMSQADLVISHAGTGSILESLRLQKPLIVIPNPKLMHNHQAELAEALHEEGTVVSSTVETLAESLLEGKWKDLKRRPAGGNKEEFHVLLDEVAGLRPKRW
jgi:beta-1,4-N-acetylglucosaminyltransferase